MLENHPNVQRALTLVAVGMLLTGGISGYTGTATANHECEFSDSLTFAIVDSFKNAGEPGTNDNCEVFHGRETINTSGTDGSQIKIDLYSSAQNVKAQQDIYNSTLTNYLQDTEEVALMVGKNAYIKELNNGSSKSAAETAAKSAISDYYAVKQKNLIASWNNTLSHYRYMQGVADNESNVSSNFVNIYEGGENTGAFNTCTWGTKSVQLTNGSNTQTTDLGVTGSVTNGGCEEIHINSSGHTQQSGFTAYGFEVKAPNSNYEDLVYTSFISFTDRWREIENQNEQAVAEVDTFVETTYDQYQSGQINTSDLLDPYTISRYYSPSDNFSNWALANARLLGLATPETLDKTGKFTISANGLTYEGMLLSDSNPESGQFEKGVTYNTSNLNGSQYIATPNGLTELDGEFTVDGITSRSGESLDTVTYEQPDYTTSNISEYKTLMEELLQDRGQLEAREIEILQSGGGSSDSGNNPFGFLNGSIYGIPNWAIITVGGGLLLIGSRSA